MRTKLLFFIFLCLLLLASCSTQRRCERRLAFVERHCPDCFKTVTVTVRDTIFQEGWQVDTMFVIERDTIADSIVVCDTFLFEKEKVKVQLIVMKDTIFASITNNPDTIVRTQVVNVPVPQPTNGNGKVWARVAALFGLLFLLSVLGWIIRLKFMK